MAAIYDSAVRNSLKGVTDSRYNAKVTHYRGINYASIAKRFAKPVPNTDWPGKDLDCTKYGPRCPQPPTDVRDLMQIPKNLPQNEPDTEDELRCANLNVTCPSGSSDKKRPVLLWIYGGSQIKSFGSAQQKLGDPGPLVFQSIEMGKSIVLVTIHYRLNIFGFGDREGELNLGLQDQRASIAWVKKYIHEFGGDPNNITLGGESAGAICTHALLASGSDKDIRRAILASASLYTTPPEHDDQSMALLGLFENNLHLMELEKGNMEPDKALGATIAGAPAKILVQTMQDLAITSMWMWQEPGLRDWQNDEKTFNKLEGLMVGDCEYESVLWQKNISNVSAKHIAKCFETNPAAHGEKLAEAYKISSDEKDCRSGALDYLNDWKFAYPAQAIARNIRKAKGKAYQYQFDQVNPFARLDSARAHHAVDLFAIFGGYDGFLNEDMIRVGTTLRKNWILFINGEEPWECTNVMAYGPNGRSTEIGENDIAARRRLNQFEALAEVEFDVCQEISRKLTAVIRSAASD